MKALILNSGLGHRMGVRRRRSGADAHGVDNKKTDSQFSDEAMRKLHQCMQEILDVFVGICEENNLRYYLIYGTLLGAIRHKGPIPWDDDVDVCMPREDYEKFKKIMLERPEGETFHIHCFENDPNYVLLLLKLLKAGTVYKVEGHVKLGMKFNEIWIDVFPLDDSPGYSFLRAKLMGMIIKWMKIFTRTRALKTTEDIKFKRKLAWIALKPIPPGFMYKITERLAKTGNQKGYDYFVSWGDKYTPDRQIMPKAWFREPVKVLYSGKYYDAPCEWDKVLTHLYGDYMKLPPEKERIGHDPIELKV